MKERPHPIGRKAEAFSLLELLLAIVLIAVIVVLGFVVFNKVEQTKLSVVNANNLKQISLAILAYAGDHQGKIPPHTSGSSGPRITTTSYHLAGGSSPRRLFTGLLGGISGEGRQSYISTPNIFYSPFLPAYKSRLANEFYKAENGAFYAGYMYYYMPRVDETGRQPFVDGLFNDRVTESPRAPLYSDIIFPSDDGSQFSSDLLFVLYLDGSIRSFPYREMSQLKMNACIARMAGM